MESVPGYGERALRLHFSGGYQTETEIDGGGSFDARQLRMHVGGGGPLTKTVRFFTDVAYANTSYAFAPTSPLACPDPAACFLGSPFGEVHSVDIAPGLALALGEAFQLQAIVPFRWQAESGSVESGVTAGLIGLVSMRLSRSFAFGVGFGVQNELEDDTRVYPVVSLDWRITPHARLVTRGGPYQGAAVELMFGPSDTLQFTFGAAWERQRFRMDQWPPNPNGVAEVESLPLLTGFHLNFGRRAYLHFEGGLTVEGSLELTDASGRLLRIADYQSAGVVRGGLRVAF